MLLTNFGIHIKVKDINKSFEFYKAFELKPIFAYGSIEWLKKVHEYSPSLPTAPENYNGITFEINNALFEIADGHIAVKQEVFNQNIESSKISAMIDTLSIDKILDICKNNGFKISVEPKVFPWGTKEVVIKDPDGFVLVFREKI